MIQRVQTIYLFISALITALLLKIKLADISAAGNIYTFDAGGIYNGDKVIFNGLPLQVMVGLIILLHIVIIFLYKKRILQIRFTVFTILIMLGLFGIIFYFAYSGFDGAKISFKIPVVFPLIAAILDYLAIRAIGKDEALIRSLNRLR